MSTKKFVSLDRLTNYDTLIKQEIAAGDSEIASRAESYTNTKISNMVGSTTVATQIANHNTSTSTHNDIRELITALTTKLNNFLDVDDTTSDQLSEVLTLIENNKGTLESLTTSKVNVSDIINNLTTNSTNKVLSAAQGVAIKTLIDALQEELDSHTHNIADVSGLQSALDGKAASSHGTHVSYSSTAPVMDGTASAGSASTVARSDHKHPTDTSRASKTEFDTHVSDTTKHITSTERTNWNAAKTHADSAHAPSNAEKNQNAFSNIKVDTTTIAADSTIDTIEFVGSNLTITPDATNDKVTFGVTKENVVTALGFTPSDLKFYEVGVAIPKESDLDSYTTIGKYYASTNAIAETIINSPSTQNFVMFVVARTTSGIPSQIIIDLTGKIFIRSRSSSAWRDWQTFATTTNLASHADNADIHFTSAERTKLSGIDTGANAYSHPTYTARTGKPTANQTPAFGGTATVSQITSDETGHVTGATDRTITIPSTLSNGTGTAGLIKTSSTVTSNSGYTACPVINGVPYYKDTNTTYTLSSLGAAASNHNHAGQSINPSSVELSGSSSHGGYIDFHYGESTSDYTSRIMETKNGLVSFQCGMVLDSNTYGTSLPSAGTAGRIFFKKV